MVYEQKSTIPENVNFDLQEDGNLTISCEGKNISRIFVHPHVKLKIESDKVMVNTESKRNQDRAVVGTWISHMNNMMKGVTDGFKYTMKIVYTHFPVTVSVKGNTVQIKNFLGAKGILVADIVDDTKVEIKKEDVIISGIDKEAVGQTSANIERICKVKGKDRRVFQDGIYIFNKV